MPFSSFLLYLYEPFVFHSGVCGMVNVALGLYVTLLLAEVMNCTLCVCVSVSVCLCMCACVWVRARAGVCVCVCVYGGEGGAQASEYECRLCI